MSDIINKPSSGLLNIALIAGGGLLLFNLLDKTKLPPLTNEDLKLLNTSAEKLHSMVAQDNSPLVFMVNGTKMTAQERSAALSAMSGYFEQRISTIAGSLMVDPNILSDAIVACLAVKDGVVREQSMELFFDFFEKWTSFFISGCLSLGEGLAKITASTDSAINAASTCAEWTFVKRTLASSEQTSTHVAGVKYTASSTKIVFGLLGSGSTQSSFHETIDSQTLNESLLTEFVPHCTSEVVDVDKVYAIMSAHLMSVIPLYRTVQLIADLAPKIENFVSPNA